MRIRAGYEITYECPAPTPMMLLLSVRPERRADLVTPDALHTRPDTAVRQYRDGFGNLCTRVLAPEGRITFSTFPPLAPPAGRPPVPIRLARGDAVEDFAVADPPYVHQPLIQTIVDELHGRGKCPSTGESGARTSWVLDECVRDYYAKSNH